MSSTNLYIRRASVFLGAVTVSGTSALEVSDNDILTTPFIISRMVGRVTTAVTTAPATLTLTWRPTVGSATGAIALGTFQVPVIAVNSVLSWDFLKGTPTDSVIGAAGPATGYGYGGSQKSYGATLNFAGPSGSLHLVSDGASDAGVLDFNAEFLTLPFKQRGDDRPVTLLDATVS